MHVVRIAVIAEHDFDSDNGILRSKNWRQVIYGNVPSENISLDLISKRIAYSIHRIKELAPNNPFYNDFLEKIAKAWETHAVRDCKENTAEVDVDTALRYSEERGGFYFLALVFAMQPKNFTDKDRQAIYHSGSWIQIIDDYSDRKKDVNKKHTPFTTGKDISGMTMFKGYEKNYKQQIVNSLGLRSSCLVVLIKLFSLISAVIA